jgi:hypothetical protein
MRKTTTIQESMNSIRVSAPTNGLTQNLPFPPSWEAIPKLIPSIGILELDLPILDNSVYFLVFDIAIFGIVLVLGHLCCHDAYVLGVQGKRTTVKLRRNRSAQNKECYYIYLCFDSHSSNKPHYCSMVETPYSCTITSRGLRDKAARLLPANPVKQPLITTSQGLYSHSQGVHETAG